MIVHNSIGRMAKRSVLAKRSSWLLLGPSLVILLAFDQTKPGEAIFNCFTPNMFKMGKVGHPNLAGYGQHPGERANWYPSTQPYQGAYGPAYGYGQHPMKLLFQPKWKGGSLFGSKNWNSWKGSPSLAGLGGANTYRPPGVFGGYAPSSPQFSLPGYQFTNEQLNVAPFTLPPSSAYDGGSWSAPIQQTQLNSYDNYTPSPLSQPAKQVIDPYGSKGASGGLRATTTKNVLLADGGYNAYDAHLLYANPRNQTYGYSYPDWYSGGSSVESPARIAQQLLKQGLKTKRQHLHQNRSAPLLQPSGTNKFTILDEPRFVGFGSVDVLINREARLSCSFSEAIDQTNRPLWIKFLGPYNSTQISEHAKIIPPFNCVSSQCRTQEVESIKDFRYKFDHGPATSTLIITEPRPADYGVYRCSAITRAIDNNPLETIYQIVSFGNLN